VSASIPRLLPITARHLIPGDVVYGDGRYLPVGRPDATVPVTVLAVEGPDGRGLITLSLDHDETHPTVWITDVVWLVAANQGGGDET
jgi:hypothetical protein